MAEQETATTRTRTIQWEDPAPSFQQAATLRPLDYARRLFGGEIPPPPMAALMDIWGVEIEEGRAVMAAEPGEQHYNPIGTVHAGLAMTLLDSAMAFAILSTLPQGGYSSTLEVKANLVRPILADTGRITCEAHVVHIGRTVGTAEARIVDGRGKLLAHGSCTCMLSRPAEDGGPSGG
jgi:uncharacterized protein (TIGR00369 family)